MREAMSACVSEITQSIKRLLGENEIHALWLRKKRTYSRFITFAIVRRLFEKHQVCLVGLLVVSTHCSQLLDAPSLFVHHLDVRGAFISCAQDIPYLAEWRQFPPTHSDAA